jgi:integrase
MRGAPMVTIKLKHVVRDVDRYGTVRYYYRQKGKPKIKLDGAQGSEEFLESYRNAVAGQTPPKRPAPRLSIPTDPRSLKALCEAYCRSAKFKILDPRTRHVRKLILDHICEAHGIKPYAQMMTRHVMALRDEKADKPEAANSIVKALRQVFDYALKAELVESNPAAKVEYLASRPGGHKPWELEQVEQYQSRHPLGTKAYLALAILLFTGQRRSDAVRLGRPHVRGGSLRFTQFKGRNRKPVELENPILPDLQEAIDATPSKGLTFLETEFGRPFTSNGFGNRFRKWCDEAGLQGYSAHGLRKCGATIAAMRGTPPHALMAIFGWQTLKETERYTKKVNQRQLAAKYMDRLSLKKSNLSDGSKSIGQLGENLKGKQHAG